MDAAKSKTNSPASLRRAAAGAALILVPTGTVLGRFFGDAWWPATQAAIAASVSGWIAWWVYHLWTHRADGLAIVSFPFVSMVGRSHEHPRSFFAWLSIGAISGLISGGVAILVAPRKPRNTAAPVSQPLLFDGELDGVVATK